MANSATEGETKPITDTTETLNHTVSQYVHTACVREHKDQFKVDQALRVLLLQCRTRRLLASALVSSTAIADLSSAEAPSTLRLAAAPPPAADCVLCRRSLAQFHCSTVITTTAMHAAKTVAVAIAAPATIHASAACGIADRERIARCERTAMRSCGGARGPEESDSRCRSRGSAPPLSPGATSLLCS